MYKCSYCKLKFDKASFHTGNNVCKDCISKFKTNRILSKRQKAEKSEREQANIIAVIKQFQTNSESFVYLVSSGNKYKIGFSTNIERRVRAFNTASPIPFRILAIVPGGKALEGDLHKQFQDRYVSGEWFLFEKKEIPINIFSKLEKAMIFLPGYLSEAPPVEGAAQQYQA